MPAEVINRFWYSNHETVGSVINRFWYNNHDNRWCGTGGTVIMTTGGSVINRYLYSNCNGSDSQVVY
jgi:hypothetical protein